jgi:hypothetical protein
VVYSSATVPTQRQHTPYKGLRELTERTLEVLMSALLKGRRSLQRKATREPAGSERRWRRHASRSAPGGV